jgi:hypothetical protein
LQSFQESDLDVLYVTGPDASADVEAASRRFPDARFLLLGGEASPGQKVNVAIEEARSPLVLVMRSDMRLFRWSASVEGLAKLAAPEAVCTVPAVLGDDGEILPTIHMPVLIRRRLRIIPLTELADGIMCLYPHAFCGLFRRETFLALGGFDAAFTNPYWQSIDFGFRAFMWGERILFREQFRVKTHGEPEVVDATRDADYKRFFLRTVAVRLGPERAELPWYRLFPYLLRAGVNPFSAYKEFSEAAAWVRKHSQRFRLESRGVCALWEPPA